MNRSSKVSVLNTQELQSPIVKQREQAIIVISDSVDGDHKKQLLVHNGDGVRGLHCSKLRRSEHKEARQHWPLYGQAHRREVPQAQEKRRRRLDWIRLDYIQLLDRCDTAQSKTKQVNIFPMINRTMLKFFLSLKQLQE